MTAGGRRLRRWLVVLSLLDVGTTAAVFSVVGPQVEGNPLVGLLVPLAGAYGALAVVLVVKLGLAHFGGALRSRMSGRRAVAFSVVALLPLSLVVVNNTAALVILGRMS